MAAMCVVRKYIQNNRLEPTFGNGIQPECDPSMEGGEGENGVYRVREYRGSLENSPSGMPNIVQRIVVSATPCGAGAASSGAVELAAASSGEVAAVGHTLLVGLEQAVGGGLASLGPEAGTGAA